ncbi:hypothetical protein AB0H97_29990 [Streptomyces sp. NPDC050788]|uniref:hypothetical protein n=1 Tax=Streptomyces sp. NPDC050788 TaxID=3155041 RepID=UPI00341365D9
MDESTQTEPTTNSPVGYGWCSWHENYARGVRLVRIIEQGSGPGGSLFACHSCREAYGLVPVADQP